MELRGIALKISLYLKIYIRMLMQVEMFNLYLIHLITPIHSCHSILAQLLVSSCIFIHSILLTYSIVSRFFYYFIHHIKYALRCVSSRFREPIGL